MNVGKYGTFTQFQLDLFLWCNQTYRPPYDVVPVVCIHLEQNNYPMDNNHFDSDQNPIALDSFEMAVDIKPM